MRKLEWRIEALLRKCKGDYGGLSLGEFARHLAIPASRRRRMADPCRLAAKLSAGNQSPERFHTSWGEFCLPAPGMEVLGWLLQEVFVDREYECRGVEINAGDVVVDCGAHVGVFARFALLQGASKVVCVEADQANIDCLRNNFSSMLDRVVIVHSALWNRQCCAHLIRSRYSDCHHIEPCKAEPGAIEALSLDEIWEGLGLCRLDFIKMDVEGAEPEVLQGSLAMLNRYKPRLAMATYHDAMEERRIRAILKETQLKYSLSCKRLIGSTPFVLFARPS